MGSLNKKKANQMKSTTPLIMLEALMLHQAPDRPIMAVRNITAGIRSEVNTIPTIDGGNVLPVPLNAPAVIISSIIKS